MVSIANADLEIYVTENSVTTVIWKDNARVLAFGDVVRITDRDGIRYEFLYTDVIAPTSPAYSSAEELADEINTYLITIPGGGGGGTITDVTATAPLTSSGGATPDISTLMTSGKLIGRHSSGSGVFEEITLGTNLSLSGDTLNAAGGGGSGAGPSYYYLNGSVNQGTFVANTYYEMSRVPIFGGGTDFTLSAGSGFQVMARFITDANDPSVLIIPAGGWFQFIVKRWQSSVLCSVVEIRWLIIHCHC